MKLAVAALSFAVALLANGAVAQDYKAPRTAFGHPSLEGTWNTQFILPLEARADTPALTVSEAESKALAERIAAEVGAYAVNFFDPEVGDMLISSAAKGMALVRGERRTRQVVQPSDGRIPLSAAARGEVTFMDTILATNRHPPMAYDQPEQRPSWERCVTLQGAPPITVLNDVNPRMIVQSRDHVVILTEYGGEARIIPFADKHGPEVLRTSMGDSIARWEGQTLVVETVGLLPRDRMRVLPAMIVPPTATVIERYTRVSATELVYQYTIVDPATYTAPWLAEYSLYATKQPIYEFACHEGNYAMEGILRAARAAERGQ